MNETDKAEVITVRSYIGTLLIGTIPIVGFALLWGWSKDEKVRKSKRNLCEAYMFVQLAMIYPMIIIVGLGGYLAGLAK